MKKSQQIIGYLIESNDINITKYYDPFLDASFAKQRWQLEISTNKTIFQIIKL